MIGLMVLSTGCKTSQEPTPNNVLEPIEELDTSSVPSLQRYLRRRCIPGMTCAPIEVGAFPYIDVRDTRDYDNQFSAYSCAPDMNEGGGEVIYRLPISQPGVLQAELDVSPGQLKGIDLDLHLLGARRAESCIDRDHRSLLSPLTPGVYYLAIDTWVDADGWPRAGEYRLSLNWHPEREERNCAMQNVDLLMHWKDCDPSLDCYALGTGSDYGVFLRTPAAGPVVKEAHLVTTADGFAQETWPQSFTDGIDEHYALSQQISGYETARNQPWAPAGEGGSEYGQGSTGVQIPPDAEAWYVNMHWKRRPARGTRVIVFNPRTGRAVVAAGGYETGPGSNTAIGGAVEEIHRYLETSHRDTLIMGFAEDQSMSYGPIECDAAPTLSRP